MVNFVKSLKKWQIWKIWIYFVPRQLKNGNI